MKDETDVIQEFNEYVNMTASELERWLKSGDSQSAGWPKENEGGESVGHDSGRKIVGILKANSKKDPEKYTAEQIQHMRKVVSYCKRHLAQEQSANSKKSAKEVKKTKSYASLKNWGHDPLKTRSGSGSDENEEDDAEVQDGESEEAGEEEEDEEEDEGRDSEDSADEQQTGDKRKTGDNQTGKTKKRETRKGKADKPRNSKATNGAAKKQKDEGEEDADEKGDDDSEGEASNGKTGEGPKPGDVVSWNWGNGQPEGKVLDVKGEKTSITTKRGNKVSRDGDPEDPAVVLDAGKSKAIKLSHELNET